MTLVHAEPAGTCGGADRPERGLGGYDGGDERLTWKCRGLIPSCLWGWNGRAICGFYRYATLTKRETYLVQPIVA
jgi:hypothetical protein